MCRICRCDGARNSTTTNGLRARAAGAVEIRWHRLQDVHDGDAPKVPYKSIRGAKHLTLVAWYYLSEFGALHTLTKR